MKTSHSGSILFDCGEGTQIQLQSSQAKFSKLKNIFITHLHGDHFFGLFGLLISLARSNCGSVNVTGPKGIKKVIENVFLTSYGRHNKMDDNNLEINYNELSGKTNIELPDIEGGFKVTAHPLTHRVPTYGYTLQEPPRLGILDIEKALSLGVPPNSKFLAILKNGHDVVLPNGVTVTSSSVVSPPSPGKKFVFLQDTFNSDLAIPTALNCDLLIHECTFEASQKADAKEWTHSTSQMAGEFARRVKAKNMILTHFGGRSTKERNLKVLRMEASKECPETQVWSAKDFMTFRFQGDVLVMEKPPSTSD